MFVGSEAWMADREQHLSAQLQQELERSRQGVKGLQGENGKLFRTSEIPELMKTIHTQLHSTSRTFTNFSSLFTTENKCEPPI